MQGWTIRTNLLWIVLAALLPLSLLAFWQGYLALDDSRELVASRLRANAWTIAESERDPFIIARHALSFAADQPDVRNIGPECGQILRDAVASSRGIVNFLRTDAQGRARCSVLPFVPGQDMTDALWWREAQGRKDLFMAQPQRGTISNRELLIMALPLFSLEGEFLGTLSAGIGIDSLKASLAQKKAEMPGIVMVADRMGRSIIAAGGPRLQRLTDVVGAQNAPRKGFALDGSEWTYVVAPLYSNELFIVYAERRQAITRSALSRIWPSLLALTLAVLFVSIAIWFGTQRLILRWLSKLQRLTARFARGEFEGEMAQYADAPTEMNALASDLHDMARSINAQEQDLRHALETKTILTRELNHRVKNNLQIVTSLLTLQADKVADPVASAALGQARSRIAALGLIHRLLHESEGHGAQGVIDMQKLLSELCVQLRATFRHRRLILLQCECEHYLMPVDQAVPATLFAVEAVSNAYQHAFAPDCEGKIDVRFRVASKHAEIEVADNGVGFAPSSEKGQMGLELIRAFGDQLGGKVAIDTGSGGTTVSLRFPLTP